MSVLTVKQQIKVDAGTWVESTRTSITLTYPILKEARKILIRMVGAIPKGLVEERRAKDLKSVEFSMIMGKLQISKPSLMNEVQWLAEQIKE